MRLVQGTRPDVDPVLQLSSEVIGQLELIEIEIVQVMTSVRIEKGTGRLNPDPAVFIKVVGSRRIRHQIKPMKAHDIPSPDTVMPGRG